SMKLDMDGFQGELEKQRERARQSWKGDETTVTPLYQKFVETGGTRFLGYEAVRSTGRITGIVVDGKVRQTVDGVGTVAEVILDQTPFYAESGGQVGDTCSLTSPSAVAQVQDTYSPLPAVVVHKVRIEFGKLAVGDEVLAQVDEERRRRIAANHTGTHILHAV